MKDFLIQNKIFISVILGTLVLLFGGVYLLGKGGSSTNTAKVGDSILVASDSFVTGGIENGKYLPKSQTAQATLVEFGDYQCPACAAYHGLVKQLITEMSGKVNFVFRNFPLSQHANSNVSAYAVEAAGLQNKFWEMHDRVYESQKDWSESLAAKDIFIGYAKDMGLDINQFKKDMDSSKIKDKVARDLNDGTLVKLNSTPTFFLNGIKLENPASYEEFKKLVEDAIKNSPISQAPSSQLFHAHFDLKVVLNGTALDLSAAKYQSTETKELDPYIHMHDGNGKVVHLHKAGIALREFFKSISVTVPENIEAYVNGKKVEAILDYIPHDLDQVLIGSSNLKLVSNDSCIYSEKCPERGKPPTENCVGGLGTGCEVQN